MNLLARSFLIEMSFRFYKHALDKQPLTCDIGPDVKISHKPVKRHLPTQLKKGSFLQWLEHPSPFKEFISSHSSPWDLK